MSSCSHQILSLMAIITVIYNSLQVYMRLNVQEYMQNYFVLTRHQTPRYKSQTLTALASLLVKTTVILNGYFDGHTFSLCRSFLLQ
jgi:hypothetical protein